MAVTSVVVSEAYSGAPTISVAPSGTATGTSGSTSSTALTCTPCCPPAASFLTALFGSSGECPGAVDNSVPVTLFATFNLTAVGSYNLADYCLPSSATLEIVADNYSLTMATRFTTFQASCSAITSPTTRFIPKEGTAFYFWIGGSGPAYFYLKNESLGTIRLCDCSSTGNNYLYGPGALSKLSGSCSPFSLTFGTGRIFSQSNTHVANWTVTFTL